MPEDNRQRPGTYAITAVTYNRSRLFQIERNAALFIETLAHYKREGKYKLHAFVVMPDHVHVLLTPSNLAIERVIGIIKGGFSHRLASHENHPIWQTGYRDRRCSDAEDFLAQKQYIHMNPVRAGLASEPHHFPFSSAYRNENPAAAEA